MATIPYTVENIVGSTIRVTWAHLTLTDDVGDYLKAPDHTFKEVQVSGTFGAGGSAQLDGTLDDSNSATLNDPQGNALVFTSGRIERVQESTATVRPRVTAGDVTTDLTVTMVLKLDGATAS